jgi:hypothetical protein
MDSSDSTAVRAPNDRRLKYFWTAELPSLALFVVAGNLPTLDYSSRLSFAYIKEPTQANLNALHAKHNEEIRTRWLYASPLGALAVAFAIPIYRSEP